MTDTRLNTVEITPDPLNIGEIASSVILPHCGAVSSFIGTTRDNFDNKAVVSLEYECYESMAKKEMLKICKELRQSWPDIGRIRISHRTGLVPVSEASVVIAVSSPHRKEAIAACEKCIDTLKAAVPIWKKELLGDDTSVWKTNNECKWLQRDD